MRKFFLTVLLVSLFAVFGFSNTLVIKGSNTLLDVAQLWVEEFSKMNPGIKITLEGAGSSTGIAALFNGTTDIANSSRWLKDSEVQKMLELKKWFAPVLVAWDGIAIVVHKNLPINNITIDQLRDIYTGKITRWNQLNPNLPNAEIVPFSRNTASGTFEVFKEKVLGDEKMSPRVRMLESSMAELETVAKTPYSIAYFGVGYVDQSVKVISVNGVMPTKQNILSYKYPLSRPLFVFVDVTKGWPEEGPIADFLRFIVSKRGQELVEKAGFVAALGQ
ncbi:phosphate ABC transporter substrate-binding protein, PhoT family [Fervidobacterium changbaicum]|uniref:Phosphate-binding protein n=1 Tax=Fervidobacterium changbaicum TaxID=310769 RepID=A0ABX5QSM9_9BACT|nr:phosphate ABC transporter substrate-binding protein [Fervidobacterium changbaicum]QAV33398.1 phosphate ABC transporter substrate-binding protein [Fervidobacterium changbaicum]SDG91181.1 phosphate ABC transporter substrate-binding protein, PhoT family [Fervidobacterium changbaicum]